MSLERHSEPDRDPVIAVQTDIIKPHLLLRSEGIKKKVEICRCDFDFSRLTITVDPGSSGNKHHHLRVYCAFFLHCQLKCVMVCLVSQE